MGKVWNMLPILFIGDICHVILTHVRAPACPMVVELAPFFVFEFQVAEERWCADTTTRTATHGDYIRTCSHRDVVKRRKEKNPVSQERSLTCLQRNATSAMPNAGWMRKCHPQLPVTLSSNKACSFDRPRLVRPPSLRRRALSCRLPSLVRCEAHSRVDRYRLHAR